jgi:prepilin-type N-terminal cleavage/methylation domain-containing protein
MKKQKGFTLIELMVVVAILSILVAVALPQYLKFSTQTKRAEGIQLLSAFHKSEISYFATEDEYAHKDGNPGLPINLGFAAVSQPKFYNLDDPASSINRITTASGDAGPGPKTSYSALLYGNLDTDPMQDNLIIGTEVIGGFYAYPGQVIVLPGMDDVLM